MKNPFKKQQKPTAIHLITPKQLQEYLRTGNKNALYNPNKPTIIIAPKEQTNVPKSTEANKVE